MTEEQPNVMQRLGIRIESVTAHQAAASMPVQGNTQPFGLLHGGATALLIETIGSYAAYEHARKTDCVAVGTELSVSHLRGTTTGHVHAVAQAQHLGATSAVYTVPVHDDAGRLIATGRLTCRILPPQQPADR